MRQPIFVLVSVTAAFLILNALLGYSRTYAILYGAFTLMAVMVSLTFFWLWVRRATPLAMGMFFGWAGAAGVMGWWWSFNLFGQPEWMSDSPHLFALLALYFVGAILHFQVIWHSFGNKSRTYLVPVLISVALSVGVQAAIQG